MILATHGFLASSGAFIVPPLLDNYPNAAAAYSLRLLRTTYTGSAIRVRRASDNTEQNIGFTALGNLDTTALTSFCGSGNGFVTTWYDQSGNGRNATQTTASSQPQIVSSGSIILDNGKPAVRFDGGGDYLNYNQSSNNLFTVDFSVFALHRVTSGSSRKCIIESTSTASDVYNPSMEYNGALPTNLRLFTGGATTGFFLTSSTNTYNNVQIIASGLKNNTTIQELFVNNSSQGSTSSIAIAANITGYNIGTYRSANDRWFGGNMQEIILYNSYESTNRSGINTNINSFYSIY
jgi:hypothetical protein